ncbi:hypothetical protein [Methylomonas albis]|nr:hypothetical protein [Methylomonas albis]
MGTSRTPRWACTALQGIAGKSLQEIEGLEMRVLGMDGELE